MNTELREALERLETVKGALATINPMIGNSLVNHALKAYALQELEAAIKVLRGQSA